jgi:hypothetical protein
MKGGPRNAAAPDGARRTSCFLSLPLTRRSAKRSSSSQRLERIRSNQEKMREMGIRQMATELASGGTDGSVPAAAPRPPRPPTRRRKHDDAAGPARRSGRTARAAESVQDAAVDGDDDGDGEPDGLIELEEYFRQRGQDVSGALRADGRYRGWVDPAVQARFGIVGPDGAAAGAGPPAAVAGGPKAKGRGAAKAWAGAQLQHNPNAYFYRHVAPGEAQAQGEWTAEEHDAFLATAAAWGVGDRWGLFASWIPQRVGYQCSAYYRDVIIPSGLVLDARFRMQRSGRAAFVG